MKSTAFMLPLAVLALGGCKAKHPVQLGECPDLLPKWSKPADGRSAFRTMVVVGFAHSQVTWNGHPIGNDDLRSNLTAGRQMNPTPLTVLDPTGAPNCAIATAVRDTIDHVADCSGSGVCGLGKADDWLHASSLKTRSAVE